MGAVRWVLAGVAVVLGFIASTAAVFMFTFAYTAALTPGPNDEEVYAALVSCMLMVFTGGIACISASVAVDS